MTSGASSKRFLTAPNAGDGYESPQAVTDASGALIASYVFAGETPIAKNTASGRQYYLTDAMGSVIGTASDTGILASTLDYDAFGNERSAGALAGDTHGDFRLHGMWKDPSGLYFVRARAYDAETGRFTSRDPAEGELTRPDSYAYYGFANSSPALFMDPSGRTTVVQISFGISCAFAMAAIATAAVGTWPRGMSRSGNGLYSVRLQIQGSRVKKVRGVGGNQGSGIDEGDGFNNVPPGSTPSKNTVSSVLSSRYPLYVAEGISGAQMLWERMPRSEQEDLLPALIALQRVILFAPPFGLPENYTRSFDAWGLRRSELRFDIEVLNGRNFMY